MPNVVLEAMAMRLPVIMTSCEGSRELVTDNGYVIDLNCDIPREFIQKAMALYEDRALAVEMGNNGYHNICAGFTWEKTGGDVEMFARK